MRYFIFFFFLSPLFVNAQFIETEETISFEKIISFPDKNKDQLFWVTIAWYTETFMEFGHLLRLENQVQGRFIAHGEMNFKSKLGNLFKAIGIAIKKPMKSQIKLRFVLKAYFKNGRTKLLLSNLRIASLKGPVVQAEISLAKLYFNKNGTARKQKKVLEKEVTAAVEKFVLNYEEAIKQNLKDADW